MSNDDLPGPDIRPVTDADAAWAACGCCHTLLSDFAHPLAAVWVGRPSLQAPAICVCALCLVFAAGSTSRAMPTGGPRLELLTEEEAAAVRVARKAREIVMRSRNAP